MLLNGASPLKYHHGAKAGYKKLLEIKSLINIILHCNFITTAYLFYNPHPGKYFVTFKNLVMYIVREIFHLKFGQYRPAKALLDEGIQKKLISQPIGFKVLTDFTGKGYRLIMEIPFESLAAFENELKKELDAAAWKEWYEKFKPLVESSEREILKQVI